MKPALAFFLSLATSAIASVAAVPPNVSGIAFEPNSGQFISRYGFVAQAAGYRLALSRAASHLDLQTASGRAGLDIQLEGANRSASWVGLQRLPGQASHFIGNVPSGWLTGVPMFARVREQSVYRGIDLEYYGDQHQIEYDFIVHPFQDPSAIRLRFDGSSGMRLDANGDLIIETAAGELRQHKPVIYQLVDGERRSVDGSFLLGSNHRVRFRVGAYERSQLLIIDPTLSYSSYFGGAGPDQGSAVAVDGSGNIYVTGGNTVSTTGSVLIRKFAPNGTQLLQADLGGSANNVGSGICVGPDGSIYVAGYTTSSDFPVSGSAAQTTLGGTTNAFLTRLSSDGKTILFSTFLGGNANDMGYGLAVDSQGAAYVTGTATSSNFPTTSTALQPSNAGGKDVFLTKYSAAGAVVFSTLVGGNSDDEGRSVAVDSSFNIYLTGSTESGNFPMVNNSYQHSLHGSVNAFVAEVSPSGSNFVYSSIFGGSGSDVGYGIAVDANGSAYIAGKTNSLDFPTTNGVYDGSFNGGDNDIFVAKFTIGQAGLIYSTYLGSHGVDEAFSIAVDAAGDAYVTGDSDSDQYPVTPNAVQPTRSGNRDVVVSELDPKGATLLFSTFLGGTQNDIGYGLTLDSSNNLYVTGNTSSSNFPVVGTAYQPGYEGNGNPDAFISVILINPVAGGPVISSGGIVNGSSFGAGPVAPGSVVSIFGSGFIGTAANATAIPLPTSLGGVSVTVNGLAAPLYYVGPTQINFQMPVETGAGPANVEVTNAAGPSGTAVVTVATTAPYLIVVDEASGQQSVILNADNSLNSSSNPAASGTIVTAYFTGVGPVNAAVTDGAASPFATSTQAYSATVGGTAASVSYMGLSPGSVGLAQANVQIPSLTAGSYPLVITIGGTNSNTATVFVQ